MLIAIPLSYVSADATDLDSVMANTTLTRAAGPLAATGVLRPDFCHKETLATYPDDD